MEAEIKTAAKWWADHLRSRPRHNSGDPMQSGMTRMVADLTPLAAPCQVNGFEEALRRRLQTLLAPTGRAFLSVDYAPAGVLADAMADAGLAWHEQLPIKSSMWIEPGRVQTRCGYGASIETILDSRDRPGRQKGEA